MSGYLLLMHTRNVCRDFVDFLCEALYGKYGAWYTTINSGQGQFLESVIELLRRGHIVAEWVRTIVELPFS